jgi:hypothetical protein
MKIHNNLPVNAQTARKSKRVSPDGVFNRLLETRIESTDQLSDSLNAPSGAASEQAWSALEDSISLLDQAMQCLESGDAPSQQLIDNIDRLRAQVAADHQYSALRQADTMLAVEAERIRSLQS